MVMEQGDLPAVASSSTTISAQGCICSAESVHYIQNDVTLDILSFEFVKGTYQVIDALL